MSNLNELQIQLEEAKTEEMNAYGKYMYYECADRGYDAQSASKAKHRYYDASAKVKEIEQEIINLKEKGIFDMNKIFVVIYWLYDDLDTMHTVVFKTREEAERFEDEVYDACENKSINVHVSIEEVDEQTTVDSALSKLKRGLSNDDETD